MSVSPWITQRTDESCLVQEGEDGNLLVDLVQLLENAISNQEIKEAVVDELNSVDKNIAMKIKIRK